MPAIADHTAHRDYEIQHKLRKILFEFVNTSSNYHKWKLGVMFDPADLIKVILNHCPDIIQLFNFQLKQTRSCPCQVTNPNNKTYIYKKTLLQMPDLRLIIRKVLMKMFFD